MAFDPAEILRVLGRHDVDYVLIGGVAARLHGSPTLTEDVDVTPAPISENLGRLAAALADLDARLAVPGVDGGLEVPLDEDTFSSPVMKFITRVGEVDVVREPAGVGGHAGLDGDAATFDIGGVVVRVAALSSIIASKTAAGRPKDRVQVAVLRELQAEIQRRSALDDESRDD